MREFEPAFRGGGGLGIADQLKLAVDLHLVRDDRSLSVAFRFDLGYRKAPVTQVRQRFLQSIVEIILQRWRLFRRREHPRIHATNLMSARTLRLMHLAPGYR